jgi:transcriptional regulator with XRE-family HTH domain
VRKRPAEDVIHGVGRRVAELRADQGLTQALFAERLGITTKHLQKIEAGELNMTIRSLVRLSDAFGVSPAELFSAPAARRPTRGRPASRGGARRR